ncbi:PREDICTED: WASH complex subunit 7 [Nicrophorus vespilloides]|uniref:WASH complex subunit 7 n=1 Tax=Nicrophorus vespilloides TaxID=110193 RepID=A0ABM1MI75_NICVS|nr:PREDICTED: WASH complex subunit 7 [Nicrophorus vespilloides]
MLETKEIIEKKFNRETHRIIGEYQLQHYGRFLEKYHENISSFKKNLRSLHTVHAKPISIKLEPKEDVALLKLVHSDNKLLSRILVSLSSICNEVNLLTAEADKLFNVFIYYGEIEGDNTFEELSKLFDYLQKTQFFVDRSQQVINLMLCQLSAILGKGLSNGSHATSFPELMEKLSELLVSIITLDLVLDSATIKDHWCMYRRAVRSMSHNPSQFNLKHESIRALDKKLIEVEAELLSGHIVQRTMDKCLDESLIVAVKNSNLSNEMMLYIQQIVTELEKDDENIGFTKIWLQANALFVLHHTLYGNMNKKLLKRILDINKKISACTVCGNNMWYPEKFLLKHIPSISKQIDVKVVISSRMTQISQRSQNINKETHALCIQACYWFIEVERIVKDDMSRYKVKQLHETCNMFVDGIKILKRISEFIKWVTNLHADNGRPMTKSVLLALCKLVEVLKCFQFIFHRNILPLSYVILLISQHLNHKALDKLVFIKKSFTQEKNYKEQQLDVLSALVVAEHALKGPITAERILIAKLALSASGLDNDNLADVRSVICRLELISNLVNLFDKLSNCSFLYWHQVLFPMYFSKLVEDKANLIKCYMVLAALGDCMEEDVNVKETTEKTIKTNLLGPLNQMVETNLRLQTHLHLKLPPSNPFQNLMPNSFKKLFPLLFGDSYINVKQEVEHYLSTMFYNLTTVVLHDWRTYGEMRRLAVLQYDLNTVEDNLPVQTLEQGLDVLEIMRNINVFVSKYLYNLNNQVFVEEWSNNKHLNTINISHVANSIRTHGIGIMNTTVNFTYQFLQNKFFIFSQFMFDEHIKSRLLKDLRFFSENKKELNQYYPYSRAEKFNFGIRKLGLNENGLSYLDQFRKLITQIGNAMGYVRLIRSGGKRCVADATCFLPDLKGVEDFNKLIDDVDCSDLTKRAANALKRDINNLVDNFEEATEYFKLLINVFAPITRDPQNIHLKNFYMIVPPLTINFIEHSLTSKDRLNKKNREGAAFTDDGFAMGLAYIIELLDQGSQLNSIHWFQSVKAKQLGNRKELERQKLQSSKEDVKLQQTLSLTEKRIAAIETEFQLLYYSFSSARIFFQT